MYCIVRSMIFPCAPPYHVMTVNVKNRPSQEHLWPWPAVLLMDGASTSSLVVKVCLEELTGPWRLCLGCILACGAGIECLDIPWPFNCTFLQTSTIETKIMRSLDHVWACARRSGKSFPYEFLGFVYVLIRTSCHNLWLVLVLTLRLWLQADNAGKEVRNASTGKWGCLLTQAGYFSQVSQCHLSVGHTHEDVGRPRSHPSCHRFDFTCI